MEKTTVVTAGATAPELVRAMSITRAPRVDGFEIMEFEVFIQKAPASNATFQLMTSMQVDFDDLGATKSSWIPASDPVTITVSGFYPVSVPSLTGKLLKYLRWVITFANTGETLTFSAEGLARRTSF
ncbi:MAG: hypothetical protein HY909_03450 [Deltaproteobacteria bacterium]|nr:hypothetical protein [Deltaproteobacteria bacterium]